MFEGRHTSPTYNELLERFKDPPSDFTPISFYFWNGETIKRERLTWQLEQLAAQGILGTIVSYIHHPDGRIDAGDPPVFSEAWWELFVWFVAESKRLGMRVGVQDYCIVNPTLLRLAADHPELRGAQLHHGHTRVCGGQVAGLELPPEAEVLSVRAFRSSASQLLPDTSVDLRSSFRDGRLHWVADEGDWTVVAVYALPKGFNPMHPSSGARAIEHLYEPFVQRCGPEVGQTLRVFFQDELDFGNRMPRWSDEVATTFAGVKGYPFEPLLAALWFDLGAQTVKFRIDYADVVTHLTETHYFRPIFDWHQQHKTLFGHDNLGRGDIQESYAAYGDAFRTMRWFSAPGCDDPHLEQPRRFAGFKVNSSIAHLYERPRVWNEGFYGSGWGITPTQLLAALNEDFAYGATLFNPHALYYTTLGGWWEWAAPDFHFRQPYFSMTAPLWKYVTRLSFLLSSGVHRCDLAVLYPSTDLEAGFEGAEQTALDFARRAADDGLDFDFVDFESLERAEVRDQRLCVAGERYQALVFPAVRAVRHSSLIKALEFKRSGGIVIALSCAPTQSETSENPGLDALIAEVFDGAIVLENAEALRLLNTRLDRDFQTDASNVYVLHRRIGDADAYFMFNRSDQPQSFNAQFRNGNPPMRWDAWTGQAQPLQVQSLQAQPLQAQSLGAAELDGQYQRLALQLEPYQAELIVFSGDAPNSFIALHRETIVSRQTLEFPQLWQTEIVPVLDNRHGDFQQPATEQLVSPQLRRFRHADEDQSTNGQQPAPAWHVPELDDRGWRRVLTDHGPRFWQLGPVPATVNLEALEAQLHTLDEINPDQTIELDGQTFTWSEYGFSERLGIEQDPLLRHQLTGPHGLKGRVPDEFIDVGQAEGTLEGGFVYLWTTFQATGEMTSITAGSRVAYRVWHEGRAVIRQDQSLGAGKLPPWDIPDYSAPTLDAQTPTRPGINRLMLRLKLESAQRARAFVVIGSSQSHTLDPLALRWFQGTDSVRFNHRVHDQPRAQWLRCTAPPGTRCLWVTARGSLSAWLGGAPLAVHEEPRPSATHTQGARRYRLEVSLEVSAAQVEASTLALRIEAAPGYFGGAILAEPIQLETEIGRAPLGSWQDIGLTGFSGAVRYRNSFDLEPLQPGTRAHLSLGKVVAVAEVRINGQHVGSCITAPWELDVTTALHPGTNTIEILVANTLANHLSDTPTPYVFEHQIEAGLFGPLQLTLTSPIEQHGGFPT
jgi:alpha-L-rhamnosidase